MSGVLDVLLEGGGSSGGGTIGPANWTDIFDDTAGMTNTQTLAVSGTITIDTTVTSTGRLHYVLNSAYQAFTGPFTVANGDKVRWEVQNFGSTILTGTVTVTDATNSATIDTFTYHLFPPV